MTSLKPCTSADCVYDVGPHQILSTGSVIWDGINEPLLQDLQNEQITYKCRKTGTMKTGPIMEVLSDAIKMECFSGKSKVLTYPTVIIHEDTMRQGCPEKVLELQQHLDNPANPMQEAQKKKLKKELDDWKKIVMGKLGESRVYDAIVEVVKKENEECLILASYTSDKYLGVLKEKGKHVRNNDLLKPLNRHETSVVTSLKMDVDPTNDVKGFLGSKTSIAPKDIHKEAHFGSLLYGKILKECANRIKKPLLDSTDLQRLIMYCKYKHGVQEASKEVDILCVFPRRKKIVHIDTKSSTEDKNVLGPLHTAAKQTKIFNQLFGKWHGEILQGYTFFRLAAFPNVDMATKFVAKPPSKSRPPCTKCQEFILTWDNLENIEAWMKKHIYTGTPSVETCPPEFQILVTRLVGFLSLAPSNNFYFHSEAEAANIMAKSITGEDSSIHGSASEPGATAALEEFKSNLGYLGLQGKEHALGSLQVFITWNQEQLSSILNIQNMSWAKFLVLVSDYGTGKSLLLKNLSRAEAERLMFGAATPGRVFFISLGGAEYTTYDPMWSHDSVYDIFTRMEWENLKARTSITVDFMSLSDVLNEMVPPHLRNSNLTINHLLYIFFLKYPMAHHYADEVPVQVSFHGKLMFPTLEDGQGGDAWKSMSGTIKLALRPLDNVPSGTNFNAELSQYEASMGKYHVQFLRLNQRMRNSAKVAQVSDKVASVLTPGMTGSIPPYINSIPGVQPKYIKTKTPGEIYTEGLNYAMKKFVRNIPVVILAWDSDKVEVMRNHLQVKMSQQVTVYNPGCKHYTDTVNTVKGYLVAPAGPLITTVRLYNGMEANHVIVAGSVYIGGVGSDAVRCAAMRATTSLVIIDYIVVPAIKHMCEVHRLT